VGEEGCSKILILGFIRTTDPFTLRKSILNLKDKISNDSYLKEIPSFHRL
jgi:hypothetical protein